MTTIVDWLMVGVTAVYVITTVAIYIINRRALKATQKQVDLSTVQIEVLKEQIRMSPNLQLFNRRTELLNQFEKEEAFSEHEPLLEILFPEQVVDLEKQIIELLKQRRDKLNSINNVARNAKLYSYVNEHFFRVNRVSASYKDLKLCTSPIIKDASKTFVQNDQSDQVLHEFQELEDEVLALTLEISIKREELFKIARKFLSETLNTTY